MVTDSGLDVKDPVEIFGGDDLSVKELGSFAAALAKAQSEFKPVKKSKEASYSSVEYKYADYADIAEATRDALYKNNLCISHSVVPAEGLRTVLLHTETGASLESTIPLNFGVDPRGLGAQITYFKKYSTCALLNIASEEDTDAQSEKDPVRAPVAVKTAVSSTRPQQTKTQVRPNSKAAATTANANPHPMWDAEVPGF